MPHINIQVVGRIAEPVRSEVGRQDLMSFFRYIHSNGTANGLDVFRNRQTPNPLFSAAFIFVGRWVDPV